MWALNQGFFYEKEKNIEFLGLYYTEVKSLSCEDDDVLQTFQADTFVKTGKWLSDDQAKKQLESE